MSGDDPTRKLPEEAAKITQPTITALFELLREIKQSVDATNAKLDSTNTKLDSTNARLEVTDARP